MVCVVCLKYGDSRQIRMSRWTTWLYLSSMFIVFFHYFWILIEAFWVPSQSFPSCCWEVLQMLTLQGSCPGVCASCGQDLQARCDLLPLTVSDGRCRYIWCTLLPRSKWIYQGQAQNGSLPRLPFYPKMCWCVLVVHCYCVALGEEKSWIAAILILLVS